MRQLIPEFILQQFQNGNYNGELTAFSMFIDISGFTAMTQNLMKISKEGAEILSNIINKVFTPSIQNIYDHYGFISTFAGDAFTAIFLDTNVEMVLEAADLIRENFIFNGIQKTKFGTFDLHVKIGISYGLIDWQIIKNKNQNSYYFRGIAIDISSQNEHLAQKGQIVFDESIKKLINNSAIIYQKTRDNCYLLKKTNPLAQNKFIRKFKIDIPEFFSENLYKQTFNGEFRQIVSCFVSFKENSDLLQNLSEIIDLSKKYGSYFNKIDFGDKGGVILIIFGAPIAQERLFSLAADFSLSVHKVITMDHRIGLAFGTAFTGFVGSNLRCEYTALGNVVNLSARIMMKADWNTILLDESLNYHILETYKTNLQDKYHFKGFKKDVSVYSLVEKRKAVGSNLYKNKMVGRIKELEESVAFLSPIFSTEIKRFAGILYIDGQAGIGKSRLVEEIKSLVFQKDESVCWFYMPCDEILKKSFNPVIYMLQSYFNQSDDNSEKINKRNFIIRYNSIIENTVDEEFSTELERSKSIIGALIDLFWENSLYEELDAKSKYENTLYAIKNIFKAIAKNQPVIINIDDAHWSDVDTQKFFETLIVNIEELPIAILASCRYLSDGSEFTFSGKVNQKRIKLSYLDNDSTSDLIESIFDQLNIKIETIPKETFSLIREKSQGNPFFIEQIVLYLKEHKIINDKAELITKNISIPTRINSIIVARTDRLSEELKEAIRTASVLGKEFYLNILLAMLSSKNTKIESSQHENTVLQGIQEDIWISFQELKYIFKHALVRESVYETQLMQKLRELHYLAAKTIEEIYSVNLESHFDDLSYHYETAEYVEEAKKYLTLAGKFAKHNFRNLKALELYQRKIKLIENELNIDKIDVNITIKKEKIPLIMDYIDTSIEIKYLLQTLGNLNQAESINKLALELSKKINDVERIAKTSLDYANIQKLKGNFSRALPFLEKAINYFLSVKNFKMIGLTYLDLGIVNFWIGKQQIGLDYFLKELDTFISIDDKPRISEAYGNLGVIYRYLGDFENAMKYLMNQLEIAIDINEKIQIARTYSNIAWVYEGMEKFKEAIEYYEKSLALNYKLGLKLELTRILDNMGFAFQLMKKFDKAIDKHQQALHIAKETDDLESLANIHANLGHAFRNNNIITKSLEHYESGLKISENNSFQHLIPEILIGKGETLINIDKLDSAKKIIVKGLEVAEKINDENLIRKAKSLLENI
ncbi:MAG: tetratricopeptide repeat protein [Candidatus Cloacimonetes bacterium]|nr:tetratricopeptide repeat protein [Candidatus Cloacimonadota bacterium]